MGVQGVIVGSTQLQLVKHLQLLGAHGGRAENTHPRDAGLVPYQKFAAFLRP
jgi:hypothetical protein